MLTYSHINMHFNLINVLHIIDLENFGVKKVGITHTSTKLNTQDFFTMKFYF